jgi:hypothetical protein
MQYQYLYGYFKAANSDTIERLQINSYLTISIYGIDVAIKILPLQKVAILR